MESGFRPMMKYELKPNFCPSISLHCYHLTIMSISLNLCGLGVPIPKWCTNWNMVKYHIMEHTAFMNNRQVFVGGMHGLVKGQGLWRA